MDRVVNETGILESLVPPEAALDMPTQSLQRGWERPRETQRFVENALLARLFVFAVTVALTAYAAWEMYHVVGQTEATILQILLVILFASTFAWIALSTASSLLGFIVRLRAVGETRRQRPARALSARTALIMPVYHEDIDAACSALRRMAEELVEAGQASNFNIFILSDSRDAGAVHREYDAARSLRHDLHLHLNVYYRNREDNKGQKAGNVADFVKRWGDSYDFMIVLDADSYMTAGSIIELVRSMEDDPHAGLIQTVPHLAAGRTLFARLQQFASEVYGPLLTTGLALWHANEGNYWGHNAIIRVRDFASACGLPELPGCKPFGGHILSHDFIEAALLRRAGFAVYMRPDIRGSYEGTPPTFADYATRDRRWAQGNLQHSKIVPSSGLHWVSRLHLFNGIMSYLASPLWLLFLITGIALSWQAVTVAPYYFPNGFSLFPTWPSFDASRALALLKLSIVILLAPKLLSLLTALADKESRRAAGGAIALTLSVIGEILLSALLAPITMLVQTGFVFDILIGRDSGWNVQQRKDLQTPLSLIVRQHLIHTVAGLVVCGITWMISLYVWLWLSPVWLGLCLSIPIVFITSRRSAGDFARRHRLFLTSQENVALMQK
jgi:membrane glycosyltransferase